MGFFFCSRGIFLTGLPQRYRDSVRTIQPGLPLFLYNYTTHQLHGIFEVSAIVFSSGTSQLGLNGSVTDILHGLEDVVFYRR